jgi:multidrug efflux pump subunit AcrA (membrane-fusion protein)
MFLNRNTQQRTGFEWLALVVLPLSFWGCAGGGGGWQMPPPVVDAMVVETAPWTVTYQSSGTVEASKKVELNAEVAGIVDTILVREGQPVQQGQVLMRLKAGRQLAQQAQASAGIASAQQGVQQQAAVIQQAEARVVNLKSKLDLANTELRRYQSLYDQEFISQLDLEQRNSTAQQAQADYNEALEQVQAAKAGYRLSRANLSQSQSSLQYNRVAVNESVIRAPFSGVVGHHFIKPGDFVAPTEKLLTLVDQSFFEVAFPVPERYMAQLHTGMTVWIKPNGQEQSQPLSAKVQFIDPVIDPDSHQVILKASVPFSQRLRHGLFCSVALALQSLSGQVVLPDEVIVPQGEKNFVYVLTPDNKPDRQGKANQKQPAQKQDKPVPPEEKNLRPMVAHQQEVIIDHRDGRQVQLKSGLTPGSIILRSGLQKVSEGTAVKARLPE